MSLQDTALYSWLSNSGPIEVFGWRSLLTVIIMGCVLLTMPPRSDRRISLVDLFAACLHIQILVFILCVPLSRATAAYATLSAEPYVFDMLFTAAAVLLNFTISGAFLVAVSWRHRSIPKIEWLPAVSILTSVITLFAQWQFRMTVLIWPSM